MHAVGSDCSGDKILSQVSVIKMKYLLCAAGSQQKRLKALGTCSVQVSGRQLCQIEESVHSPHPESCLRAREDMKIPRHTNLS